MLPASLRSKETEQKYQTHKELDLTTPLEDEQDICSFDHWRVIANRYPYDGVFQRCDLLIPKRKFSLRGEMTVDERDELDWIMSNYVEAEYETVMENTMRKRSVASLYHLHLCVYKRKRSEFTL